MSPVLISCEPVDGSLHFAYYPRSNAAYTTVVHRYRIGGIESGYSVEITIRPGTPTDFASIPRLFWMLWPKFGPWARAALYHDEAYRSQNMTRRQADTFFIDMMAEDGVSWWNRHCLWLGVRIGGGYFWRKQAKLNAAAQRAKETDNA